jgi:Flp pilus assembly protein TadD
MKLAVLPFNAAEGTQPAYGRQFVNFASDTVRAATGAEINVVSYLTEIQTEAGPRAAYVNIADTLAEAQWIEQLFGQSDMEAAIDGLVRREENGEFHLTVRLHRRGEAEPAQVEEWQFPTTGLFEHLHRLIKMVADTTETKLPDELAGEKMEFGTDNAEAFLRFLEGYDSWMYVQQTNGGVALEFNPQSAIDALVEAVEADPEFLAPYETLIQFSRACTAYRIGTFEMHAEGLRKLAQLVPDDYKAYFGLGEIHQSVGDNKSASDYYEKAASLEPNEPALYTRLGMAQMATGMPVNAERNFRKALEIEGEDKPSMDYLAMVLQQTGRAHEVPPLWKEIVDAKPTHSQALAKYSIALFQAGKQDEGIQAFETALENAEDKELIKRYYAPVLAQTGELDRAMDFYEDCIDLAPNDVQLLSEYARTLQAAGRSFEVPKVLQDLLNSNPDPNVRAETLAWLIELEQPKRAQSVDLARQKMEQGDFQGAMRDLKPLRNWLADYWKLWALLSAAYNRLERYEDAEEAANRLLQLYPSCEPGYGELINALNAQGRDEEAYNVMRHAAQNMPGSLSVHVNLALAAKRAGHDEEARSLARQIREAIGSHAEIDPVLAEIER